MKALLSIITFLCGISSFASTEMELKYKNADDNYRGTVLQFEHSLVSEIEVIDAKLKLTAAKYCLDAEKLKEMKLNKLTSLLGSTANQEDVSRAELELESFRSLCLYSRILN